MYEALDARSKRTGTLEDGAIGVDARSNRRRVVVVGPCASGKTTLVGGLRSLGYQAVVCGQEHSEISSLWRRSAPDVLIALDVDLETIRRRRGQTWPAVIYERQRQRLAEAMAAADLILDVSNMSEVAVLARVLRTLDLVDLGG
jgi:hypothetical protein